MIVFALIAEAGALEHQACLLVESIRLFAGAHCNAPILVISPRAERRPSYATRERLKAHNATYIEFDIASVTPHYGTSFRLHASAKIERDMGDDVLVFLDSDVIFTGEPDFDLGACAVAARPVDVKGMCSTGPQDPNDAYWRALCKSCGVSYDAIPYVVATVDGARVKASYNGGLVAAKASAGVFQRTEDFFVRSVAAGLRPWPRSNVVRAAHGVVTGRGAQMWGSSQACLSLAAWGAGESVKTLASTYNFPAHIDAYVARGDVTEPLIAVHYHHLFAGPQKTSLHQRLNVPQACVDWLEQRLPLAC